VGTKTTWEFWRNEIITKFSTDTWKRKVKTSFRKDRFDIQGDAEPAIWVTRQAKRIQAVEKDANNFTTNDRLLSQLDKKKEYKMKIGTEATDDLSEFIIQLEHIVNIKKKGKSKKDNYKEKTNEKLSEDKSKTATCFLCGEKGHKSNKCPNPQKDKTKSKKIALMHHEENQAEISDKDQSDTDSLPEDDDSSSEVDTGYSTNAILSREEKFIAKISPSKEKHEANKVKIFPVKNFDYSGKMHKSGGTDITNVICNKFKIKCLIDGGAFCSIISPKVLDKIFPDWKNQLQIMQPDKFYSCNSRLNTLDIIKLDIIFPHSTTNVQMTT
jgi:hypothetical protein